MLNKLLIVFICTLFTGCGNVIKKDGKLLGVWTPKTERFERFLTKVENSTPAQRAAALAGLREKASGACALAGFVSVDVCDIPKAIAAIKKVKAQRAAYQQRRTEIDQELVRVTDAWAGIEEEAEIEDHLAAGIEIAKSET